MKIIIGYIKSSTLGISKIRVPEFSKRKGRLVKNPKFEWYKKFIGKKPHSLKIIEVNKHEFDM